MVASVSRSRKPGEVITILQWRSRWQHLCSSAYGTSEAEIGESRVVIGTATQWPVEFALALGDRKVVDAGDAASHQTMLVELPILVAVGAEPVAGVVVPLVAKAHGDAVLAECPQFFDEPVVKLLGPFAGQELKDSLSSDQELGAVSPDRIQRVGERDSLRIARVPGVFRFAHLFDRGAGVEWWQRWSWGFRRVHGFAVGMNVARSRTSE